MAVVFIAGHGRMVLGDPTETVPGRISMGWAVPEKHASRPQVSRNMIAGRNGLLTDVANAGERYNQHWLVPDGAENMILKAKDLFNALAGTPGYEGTRNLGSATYWLLQPRANNAVTLSAILEYLERTIPGSDHIDVLWTCCRSPVGLKGLWTAAIRRPWDAYQLSTRKDGDVIGDPMQGGEGFRINRFINADGVVTLIRGSDSAGLLNRNNWVGLSTSAAPGGVLTEGQLTFVTDQKLPE